MISPKAALRDLLMELFSPDELKDFLYIQPYGEEIRRQVDDKNAQQFYTQEIVEALGRRGHITPVFFELLQGQRPERNEEITKVAALWEMTSSRPAGGRWRNGVVAAVVFLGVGWAVLHLEAPDSHAVLPEPTVDLGAKPPPVAEEEEAVEEEAVIRTPPVAQPAEPLPPVVPVRLKEPEAAPLELSFAVLVEKENGDLITAEPGDKLYSGQGYQVFVRPSVECFLYIFQTDISGSTFRLFPETGTDVEIGGFLNIPGDGLVYELDRTQGLETIHLIASSAPIERLSRAEILSPESLEAVLEDEGVPELLGVKGIRKVKRAAGQTFPSEVNFLELTTNEVTTGSVRYDFEFLHL